MMQKEHSTEWKAQASGEKRERGADSNHPVLSSMKQDSWSHSLQQQLLQASDTELDLVSEPLLERHVLFGFALLVHPGADPGALQTQMREIFATQSLLKKEPHAFLNSVLLAWFERAKSREGFYSRTFSSAHERIAHAQEEREFLFSAKSIQWSELSAELKFVLGGLHFNLLTYGELSKILNRPIDQIEKIAWRARVQLQSDVKRVTTALQRWQIKGRTKAHLCPEVESNQPWTQRFLDDEVAEGASQLYLKNHLMTCDFCQEMLHDTRKIFQDVDLQLPLLDTQMSFLKEMNRFPFRISSELIKNLKKLDDQNRIPFRSKWERLLFRVFERYRWAVITSIVFLMLIGVSLLSRGSR